MGDNSIINIDFSSLSVPANTLINRVSDAVGGIFKPYQITRVAKAKSEAEKIKTLAEIEITELQRRALQRFVIEETKKQYNIESITKGALPQINNDAQPQKMEEDWIVNFFDKAKLISDPEVQELWSKILAGEANTLGSFSKRTVNFLSSLDKNDALLFTKLCSFNWIIGSATPLIYDESSTIYGDNGINFNSVQHLNDIGLVSFNPLAGYRRLKLPKIITVAYFSNFIQIEFQNEKDNELNLGKILLTNVGAELSKVCTPNPLDGFQEYVINKWFQEGLILSSPILIRPPKS